MTDAAEQADVAQSELGGDAELAAVLAAVESFTSLPFVRVGTAGPSNFQIGPGDLSAPADLWAVEPVGHSATDFERGLMFAGEALKFSRAATGFADFPYAVLREMFAKGRFGNVEEGFVYRIASAARVAAHN